MRPSQPKPPAQLVDECGELRNYAANYKPKIDEKLARLAKVEDELLGYYEREPADKAFVAEGSKYRIPISARENQSKVKNLDALLKNLGPKQFVAICKVTLQAIRKAVPDKKQLALYIQTARSGPREIGDPVRKVAS